MWHERAIDASVALYQQALHAMAENVAPGALLAATNALIAFNDNAVELAAAAGQPRPALGGFDSALLAAIPNAADRVSLINNFNLGYGRPLGGDCGDDGRYMPGMIIFGTEHAFDAANDLRCLAVEGCALSGLWKAGATPQEVANVAGVPDWAQQPLDFYRNPSQHFGELSSGHTWRKGAGIVTGARTMEHISQMFQRVYMMEINSYPARRAVNGAVLSAARLDFLKHVISDAGTVEDGRLPISTLWFHGMARRLEPARTAMVSAFFALDIGQQVPPPQQYAIGGCQVLVYTHGDKQVVHTVALAHFAPATYWDKVRTILNPRIPSI